MRLRPAPTHWFETYVPRNESVYALEALAETGAVQLELDPRLAEPLQLEPVSRLIDRFQRLRRRHKDLLPAAGRSPPGRVEAPERTARKALDYLETWSAPLDALREQQVQLEAERQNLILLCECLTAMKEASRDSAHLFHHSQFLYKGVFACPVTRQLPADICAAIDEFVPGHIHNFFIIADQPGCRDMIERSYHSEACLSLQVPHWLSSDPVTQQSQIEARLAEIALQADETQRTLDEKKKDPGLAAALADIDLLVWYLEHSTHLGSTRKLCHITGWTTADSAEQLQTAFRRSGIHGAIRFAEPPGISKIPVDMPIPWWAEPFHFIPEMLGTPDSTEIDASKLLPVIVPLLFGYMFPDVGHGLILALFSAALYRRWPEGRFLIPCGISAMLFGLVFGEIFGLEHVLDPLWIRPLEHPLEILLAPLLLGVGLILIGLVFNGVGALWRGEAGEWLLRDAAVPVIYCSVLAGLFVSDLFWIAVFALVWFVLGQLLSVSANRLANLGRSIGVLLQSSFELALNTISFLRVGAFALAHAGLSAVILGLTAGISNEALHLLLLALGHIFIVAIEGLVVFVQTTRLVLFEFFIHFLKGEGRMFRPMGKPPHGAGAGQP